MRKPIIAANWKLNKGPSSTEDFLRSFLSEVNKQSFGVDIVIAPSFVSLSKASELLSSETKVQLAAQNVSEHDSGAYTGEVSVMMLKELFLSYVIIGHSERRALYGETDQVINAKIKKAREANFRPIFCIGETLEERESGKLEDVLRTQITQGLLDIPEKDLTETVVAYEPVWAIGTGVTATSEQAQEAHAFVRSVLKDLYGEAASQKVRIQYGGSVKPANAKELLSQPDIDGALVGGASLEPSSFFEIIRNSAE